MKIHPFSPLPSVSQVCCHAVHACLELRDFSGKLWGNSPRSHPSGNCWGQRRNPQKFPLKVADLSDLVVDLGALVLQTLEGCRGVLLEGQRLLVEPEWRLSGFRDLIRTPLPSST